MGTVAVDVVGCSARQGMGVCLETYYVGKDSCLGAESGAPGVEAVTRELLLVRKEDG